MNDLRWYVVILLVTFSQLSGCLNPEIYRANVSHMDVVAMYYSTRMTTGNSVEDLITTKDWHDYTGVVTDVDFLGQVVEQLAMERDSVGDVIGGVRIAAILYYNNGRKDTLAFGGYKMIYQSVVYNLDTVLLRTVAERLPQDHRDEIEKFIAQSFRGWEQRRKESEEPPVPPLRDLQDSEEKR